MKYDVSIYRSGKVESKHKVLYTDINSSNGYDIYLRSSIKIFQLLPFVVNEGVEKFKLKEEALALFSSSHSGEPQHTKRILKIIQENGFKESDLFCTPHLPLYEKYSKDMIRRDEEPSQVHNNCSGKHTSMLLLCKILDIPINNYYELDHPLQKFVYGYLSDLFDKEIDIFGVDGCGAPIPYLNTLDVATIASDLSRSTDKHGKAWSRIVESMKKNPYLIAGTDRFDSTIIDQSDGKILAKVGAEGVIFIQTDNNTIILKSIDGSRRATDLTALSILRNLGLLQNPLLSIEKEIIYNKQNQVVGEIKISK